MLRSTDEEWKRGSAAFRTAGTTVKIRARSAAVAIALLVAGCASPPPPTTLAEVGELRPGTGYIKGYLSASEVPDSLALLPPPPAAGSAALAADEDAFRTLTALRDGPRGRLAARDANLAFPKAPEAFSCALGIVISEHTTPHLNMLLWRTLADVAATGSKAKRAYKRVRPFVVLKAPTCTPTDEVRLAGDDDSYPSGHAGIGWAWALVLTQVAPDHADALLARGRAFAQSRGICGVHWKSDIEAGRLVGTATVARLQANPSFDAQAAAAREEIANARTGGQAPAPADCDAEARAMSLSSRLAP
jgi:acid phosphatase (class A)